ncbi:hypothetical protein E4631_09560 [Hymenobacter sp. UV11]|uniref:hypothetical protein n=1 Tax=Hymenobacter sp. UV11 TaxID=1849735 RepID=UPI001061AC56|nr:hypothetical protein [Hymenobacter sp. UV11]TDN39700.1 hypothetical protein A8B98_17125 [Hymenobacter sp. UV11]TFZ67181.1 hypothetical protein E4631_09560 [Hymenobacter sp. UV11]
MKKLLSYLAPAAVVLLASCSSEPSDWRPDQKVSLDQIAPGTRPTDNFDQGTAAAPNQAKGGAISTPTSSRMNMKRAAPTPGAVQTADTQEGTAARPGEGTARPEGTAAPGTPGSTPVASPGMVEDPTSNKNVNTNIK